MHRFCGCRNPGRGHRVVFNRMLLGLLLLASQVVLPDLLAQNQIMLSTVRVEAKDKNGGTKTGAGFAVQGGIITAYHVVENSVDILLLSGDGDDTTSVDATMAFFDKELDLAFLKTENNFVFPDAVLETQYPVQPGTEVYAIGNPLGFTRTVSKGIVSASTTNKNEDTIIIDALIRHGNSGGPLVNGKGKVIGVVLGLINAGEKEDLSQRFSYVLPAKDVQQFISQKGHKPNGFIGVAGKSIPLDTQFGVRNSLEVTKVVKPCGLMVGDVITLLNNVEVESQKDLVAQVRKLSPGSTAKAFIRRENQYVEIDVHIFPREQ